LDITNRLRCVSCYKQWETFTDSQPKCVYGLSNNTAQLFNLTKLLSTNGKGD